MEKRKSRRERHNARRAINAQPPLTPELYPVTFDAAQTKHANALIEARLIRTKERSLDFKLLRLTRKLFYQLQAELRLTKRLLALLNKVESVEAVMLNKPSE